MTDAHAPSVRTSASCPGSANASTSILRPSLSATWNSATTSPCGRPTSIRGDVNFIRIGARTNIQDGTVVHVSHDGPHAKLGGFATRIGSDVTIGHKAIIHACTIEDAVLIGMGAIVLDGAVVKKHALVGAGALVPPGKVVGEGEMWLGSPAKFARKLKDSRIEALYYSAQHYVRLKGRYLNGMA
jgi:carbonic anhydrase/acetyltransferase-like protein (isoleucine patch superfamily)